MEKNIELTQKKLLYFQQILKLSIQASEQFDVKLLDFATYYTYIPETNEFRIPLDSSAGEGFRLKITKMNQSSSIAITIRYQVNGMTYPILVSYATDDNLEGSNLVVKGYSFKLHTPTLLNLGFEYEELGDLTKILDDLTIREKILEVTKILQSRFERVTIIPQQFLCGVVSITSFDKIIKERVDYSLDHIDRIKESDILYKYLNGKLSSTTPNRINIVPVQEQLNEDQKEACESFFGTRLQTLNGPPGTGKSQTITEFLLQSILLDKKVLLTSYNNKPVDVVYKKMQEVLGVNIPFPCYSTNLQYNFREFVVYISNLKLITTKKQLSIELDKAEEEFEKLQEKFDLLDSFNKSLNRLQYIKTKYSHILEENTEDKFEIRAEFFAKQDYLATNESKYLKLQTDLAKNKKKYSQLLKSLILLRLNHQYIQIYDRDLEVLEDAMTNTNRIYQARKVLEDIVDNSPIVFSNILKAINNLPIKKNYFDYVIVDEASQCNSIAVVPLLQSTRALIVVGDPKQLSHIPSQAITPKVQLDLLTKLEVVEDAMFDYTHLSLFDYVDMMRIDSNQKELFLSYHYRCENAIIEFSNQNYYNNRLRLHKDSNKKTINWHHIEGQGGNSNTNEIEANMVLSRLFYYLKSYKPNEIGVISQYRNQAFKIKKILMDQGLSDIQVGTIHTFQGDEKKVILYSPVYSQGSSPTQLKFINVDCYNILNVAITRGQEIFEVVGDRDFALNIKSSEDDIYYKLAKYINNL
jgi:superfamily I DNA and/or RNA helicase